MMLSKMHIPTTIPTLHPNLTQGSRCVNLGSDRLRLEIPAGPAGRYRLAQIDDYHQLPRWKFHWSPPVELSLTAQASSNALPGTWGFGFWNDPFSLALPAGARAMRLPILPNTAWFFFASAENFLSLRDNRPASGSLAAVFRSPRWPGLFSILATPLLPLLIVRPSAQWLRRLGRVFVTENSSALPLTPDEPREYRLVLKTNFTQFWLDDILVLETQTTPASPLGIVIWLDNQYAAWLPTGKLKFGTLANPDPAWVEIIALRINGQMADITCHA